ncbi:hypothetical protein [Corynebacterium deserti]|uniref:hypothetical protein n=1 Tax=Corynebacterium deserti TaxID=1408191 RepID=UPI0012E3100A|nr:hypothetical protein [Corynebacterium deserti]
MPQLAVSWQQRKALNDAFFHGLLVSIIDTNRPFSFVLAGTVEGAKKFEHAADHPKDLLDDTSHISH